MTLKLRLADFSARSHSRSLPQAVADRKTFAELGHALLDELLPLPLAVRLMGLTLSSLESGNPAVAAPVSGGGQLSLF